MKKVLIYTVVLFAFVACTTPSNEKLVENSFKEYVQMNFDDPSSLQEILSVTICDTVSSEITQKMVEDFLHASIDFEMKQRNHLDSLQNIFLTFMKNAGNKEFRKLKSMYEGNENILALLLEVMVDVDKDTKYITSADYLKTKTLQQSLEETVTELNNDSTFILVYEIKTRILTEGDLKIEKYYGQMGQDKTITITENNSIENLPVTLKDAYKKLEEYGNYRKQEAEMYDKMIKNISRLNFYFGI